jgi:hypothetical protein
VTTTAAVTDAPLTLTGGLDVGAVQQQSAPLTLATFTDGNSNATIADYTATINWGDGSGTVPATVVDSGDGVFSISGSHAYAQTGAFAATITITDVDGATASTTSTVTVGNVYAGIQSDLTVASFQDSNSSVQASQFTATIQWGDGTQSNGTVVGGNGTFSVQGSHTYAVDSIDQPGGAYQVTVTISDPSGNTLTSNGGVTVVRPPMALVVGTEFAATGNAFSNVEVASFTEPDASDTASEFSALINWGDGTALDPSGVIVGSNGMYHVLGSHTYATGGMDPIQVEILQDWAAAVGGANRGGKIFVATPNPNNLYTTAPQLIGPRVVTGNSLEAYTWKYLDALNIRGATPMNVLKFTWVGANRIDKLNATAKLTMNNGVLSSVSFIGSFPNVADQLKIQLMENNHPVYWPVTINVVEIEIKPTKSPTNRYINGTLAKLTFAENAGPFIVGDPGNTPPNGTRFGKNIPMLKSVDSSTLFLNSPPMQGQGGGIGKKNGNTIQNVGVVMGPILKVPGLTWFATVALIAPPGVKNVLSQVHVGFVQDITINTLRGTYANGKTLNSALNGKTFLDLGKILTKPYYQGWITDTIHKPNPDFVFFDASDRKPQKTILGYDTPSFDVPLTAQQLTQKQIDKLTQKQIALGAASFINRIEGNFSFTTSVVASLNDSNGFNGAYWREYSMKWSFQEDDRVVAGPAVVPLSTQKWLAAPLAATITITPPTKWKEVTFADNSLDNGGPNNYGNKLLSQYKFN